MSRVSRRRPRVAHVRDVEPGVSRERASGEKFEIPDALFFVFVLPVSVFVFPVSVAVSHRPPGRFPVKNVSADSERRVSADVSPDARKAAERVYVSARRSPERKIVPAENAASDLDVKTRRKHVGDLRSVVVKRVVEKRPVGKGAVGEIVRVGVVFVQVSQDPESASRPDAGSRGKPETGQGFHVRLFELDLDRSAVVGQRRRHRPAELVVYVGGQVDLRFSDGNSFLSAFSLVAQRKAGNFSVVGRKVRVAPVEHHSHLRVEVVAAHGPAREAAGAVFRRESFFRRLSLLHFAEPALHPRNAVFVFRLHGLDFLAKRAYLRVGRRKRGRGEKQ